MGEYAVDQMMHEFERMTGTKANRSDFEDDDRPKKKGPHCQKCGKIFLTSRAVQDHINAKHSPTASAEAQPKEFL